VKFHSILTYTDIWYTDRSEFMCSNWNRRNLLVVLNLMSKASAQKNVMDPWPAPYQNRNELLHPTNA